MKIFEQLKVAGRGHDDNKPGWLDRFAGTPLFEEAKALVQERIQFASQVHAQESQINQLRKQVGVMDWQERTQQEETFDLRKSMLDLQLADLQNQSLAGAAQPDAAPPAPEVAPAGVPKMASSPMGDALKGLRWDRLQNQGGKILSSSVAPAAIGALVGGVANAATARGDESTLGAFGKGAIGGGLLAGGASAAVRAGTAVGLPQAFRKMYPTKAAPAAAPKQLTAGTPPPAPAAPVAPAAPAVPDLDTGTLAPKPRGGPPPRAAEAAIPDLQLGGVRPPSPAAGPQLTLRMDGGSQPIVLGQPQMGARPQQINSNTIHYTGGQVTI